MPGSVKEEPVGLNVTPTGGLLHGGLSPSLLMHDMGRPTTASPQHKAIRGGPRSTPPFMRLQGRRVNSKKPQAISPWPIRLTTDHSPAATVSQHTSQQLDVSNWLVTSQKLALRTLH